MYEVIGGKQSRTFRVLWALEELGLDYTHTPEKPRSDLVTRLNPTGKIPILKDGDDVVTDSTAIITYLADKHGGLTAPAGTIARAQQDGITHQVLDDIDAVLWTAARHSFILPEEHRVDAIKPSLKWEYARNLEKVMVRVKGPFLMGEEFTIPDIILAHCGGWAMNAGFPTDNAALKDYVKRCRARPSFQKLTAKT
ncbi:glutathione S-transferase family protein [Shimia biformata]|uniref:glutathione S-transferase family protein n=1 Tax=Shimia biformata TaxID=1294299 RepID=UPI0019524F48|nr:glutathione S-transferase family protein [Shimia biformata]